MIKKESMAEKSRVRVTFELPSDPWVERVNLEGGHRTVLHRQNAATVLAAVDSPVVHTPLGALCLYRIWNSSI